jgi:hypothetical protein
VRKVMLMSLILIGGFTFQAEAELHDPSNSEDVSLMEEKIEVNIPLERVQRSPEEERAAELSRKAKNAEDRKDLERERYEDKRELQALKREHRLNGESLDQSTRNRVRSNNRVRTTKRY